MIKFVIPVINVFDKNYHNILLPSIQKWKSNATLISNSQKNKGLFEKYNHAIKTEKFSDDDIIVLCHSDVKIHDEYFQEKLEMFFNYFPNVGIAGVIGTTQLNKGGGWWHCDRKVYGRGKILQGYNDGSTRLMEDRSGSFNNVITVDGCILFCKGKFLKNISFDEYNFQGLYHFYDADMCLMALCNGWKVGVVDVLVEHRSEGPMTENWHKAKEIFYKKWKFLDFPVTLQNFQ